LFYQSFLALAATDLDPLLYTELLYKGINLTDHRSVRFWKTGLFQLDSGSSHREWAIQLLLHSYAFLPHIGYHQPAFQALAEKSMEWHQGVFQFPVDQMDR
jgi:hypothetical protein